MKKLVLSLGLFCALNSLIGQITNIPIPMPLPGKSDFKVTATEQFQNLDLASGNVYYRPGKRTDNSTHLVKPILFVEGIDFEVSYNHTGMEFKLGQFGWGAFWGGDLENYGMLEKCPELLNQLYELGYDILLLDFEKGTDYMQNNSMLLVEVLKMIKNQNPEHPTTLVGNSMGGQIAKYALNYLESNEIPHCVTKYVSFDSPHSGANIPIGLQKTLATMDHYDYEDASDAVLTKLRRPATKQLLMEHVDDGAESHFNSWYNDINTQNLPENTRNVAIVNGSGDGVNHNISPGQLIFDYQYDGLPGVDRHIKIFAAQNGDVADIKLPIGEDFGPQLIENISGLFSFNHDVHTHSGKVLDHIPGSKRVNMLDLHYSLPSALQSDSDIGVASTPQTFIPSYSALGLNYNQRFTNLNANKSSLPTQFEDFYAPHQNEHHVEITDENIAWILNELEKSEYTYESVLVGNEINIFKPETRFLKDIQIGSNSVVYINGDIADNFGDYPQNGSHAIAQTCDCESSIVVKDGGRFQLGDTNGNSADFKFTNGSTLIIKSGSKLQLHPGSKLIFQKNASLIFEEGAIIENFGGEIVIEEGAKLIHHKNVNLTLEGANASLNIQGDFELKPYAVLEPKFINTIGSIIFDSQDENVTFGAHSSVKIIGNSQNQLAFRINQNTLTFPSNMDLVTFEKAKVELNAGVSLIVDAVYKIEFSSYQGLSNGYDKIELNGLKQGFGNNNIDNAYNGIIFNTTGEISFNSLDVSNCAIGITFNSNQPKIGDINIADCGIGIKVNNNSYGSLLYASVIENCNEIGVEIINSVSSKFTIANTSIANSNYGLVSENSTVYLECSRIQHNQTGVYFKDRSKLIMASTHMAGKNDLSLNDLTLEADDSWLYMKGGNNKLYTNIGAQYPCTNNNVCGTVIRGTLRYSNYYNLDVSNNQWKVSNNQLTSNMINVSSSLGGRRILLRDYYPRNYQGCETEFVKRDMEITNSEEKTENSNLSIYPNPSHGIIHLSDYENTIEKIEVFDLRGKLILSELGESNNVQIDLKQGLYIIKVYQKNQAPSSHQVIVN